MNANAQTNPQTRGIIDQQSIGEIHNSESSSGKRLMIW